MKLGALKEKREALVVKMEALHELSEKENRNLTADEKKQFDAYIEEHRELVETIERAEKISGFRSDVDKIEKRDIEPANGRNVAPGETRADQKLFASFGEQLQAVARACNLSNPVMDKRLVDIRELRATGLGETVGSEGGFLVQTDFATELLKRTYETGILASRVRRIPISQNANGLKMFGVDETSRVDGSRWGGVQAYWADEAAQKTASKPKFREMNMKLHKLVGLCYATDELLEDATALEAVIMQAFTEEFGFKVDDAIFRGDGAGKPLGILNASALVTVAAEGGQAADTIKFPNIVKMYARLFARSYPNAVFLANQNIIPQLHQMVLAGASSDVPVYLPANQAAGQPFSTLYGLPVLFIEHASSIGDVGDIVLADLSQYLMIDKGGIKSASSIHVRFIYDESVFRFVYRVDGQPAWSAALTPYKGSETQSPFITLAAR